MQDVRNKLKDFFKDLKFSEEEHKYTVNGEVIKLSVSSKIKEFYTPFDTEKISAKVAEKTGENQQDIKNKWKQISKEACEHGTEVHLFGELYPFDRTLIPNNPKEEAIKKFWDELPKYIIPVYVELRMYHKIKMYAGTADIILYNTLTGKYIIADYKTNKDLFKNYKEQKLLYPFQDYLETPLNKYQIQLNFYQILLEQVEGIEVSHRRVIWLLPDGNYKLYDCEDLRDKLEFY